MGNASFVRRVAAVVALVGALAGAAGDVRAVGEGQAVPSDDDLLDFLVGPDGADGPPAEPGLAPGNGPAALEALFDDLERGASVGAPVSTIALVPAGRAPGVRGWLETAFAARAPVWAPLRGEIARLAASRFALQDAPIPPDVAATLAALHGTEPDRARIAEVNLALGVEAVLLADVSGGWNPLAPPQVSLRLLAGRAPVSTYTVIRTGDVPQALTRWNAFAATTLLLPLGLALAGRRLGGGGSLLVRLSRRAAPDPSIVYTVYVATRAFRGDTSGKHVIASQVMPGDVLPLRGLPVGELFVAVRRLERDPATLQVTSNEIQERAVRVARGAPLSVGFEMKADLTAVKLDLRRADASLLTAQAVVVERGRGGSPRYVRGGTTTFHLPEGEHALLVGIDHRAYRISVSVPARTRELAIGLDVDDPELPVFSGCREAVTPFLNDDLRSAADVLERKGDVQAAALLRAELHQARGEKAEAARALEAAGRLEAAAAVRAETGDAAGTAQLLLRSGDYVGAGHQLRRAGDLVGAARAFAEGASMDEAVDCARQSGDLALLAEILDRKGDRIEAARVSLEIAAPERAITLLQGMPISDPRYGEASLLLAELLLQRAEPVLALQKLDEAVQLLGAETNLELREQIARALEERGELALALDAYETIRKRDLQYPGSAEKIEALRAALRAPAGGGTEEPKNVTISSRYTLEQEIGRGGMGVVYRARDRMLGRIVALKRLPENLREHPTAVKFFLREARSVAALNHPNIVTLFDAGQEDGTYYITMEYLEGQPLHALLARRKRLSVRDTVALAIQVTEGLACAHGEAIVHRDIKPSNLFLTRKGRVKIMDFGLAKTLEEVRKHASVIAGTPYYMAPEQALGEPVDGRTDLYAFGVTLFELLTGSVPFQDGDVTYHHRHTPPPDVRGRAPEAPAALAELVLELMAKRPEDRPTSAMNVLTRLKTMVRSL